MCGKTVCYDALWVGEYICWVEDGKRSVRVFRMIYFEGGHVFWFVSGHVDGGVAVRIDLVAKFVVAQWCFGGCAGEWCVACLVPDAEVDGVLFRVLCEVVLVVSRLYDDGFFCVVVAVFVPVEGELCVHRFVDPAVAGGLVDVLEVEVEGSALVDELSRAQAAVGHGDLVQVDPVGEPSWLHGLSSDVVKSELWCFVGWWAVPVQRTGLCAVGGVGVWCWLEVYDEGMLSWSRMPVMLSVPVSYAPVLSARRFSSKVSPLVVLMTTAGA